MFELALCTLKQEYFRQTIGSFYSINLFDLSFIFLVIWVLNYAENLYHVHVVQNCIFLQLPRKICVNVVFWNFKTYSMNFLVLIFSFFTSYLFSERRHTQVVTGKNGNIQLTLISPFTVKYLKWEGNKLSRMSEKTLIWNLSYRKCISNPSQRL